LAARADEGSSCQWNDHQHKGVDVLASASNDELLKRVMASIRRVAEVQDLTCQIEEGRLLLRGTAETQDEAVLCGVVARLVPGVGEVINEIESREPAE
jgi:hypothetical protein